MTEVVSSPAECGDPDSPICIIAEAPAKTEIRLQEPLVGQSGFFFNELLRDAGIARQGCYILNVWQDEIWKSRDDKVFFNQAGDHLYYAGKGLTKIGLEEAGTTLRRLAQCKANVIVPIGGPALSLLYGDTRITKWRGSILEANREGIKGRKLVPTFHPQFVLRGNYIHRYTMLHDLQRANAESASPRVQLPARNLYIDPSFDEVVAWLRDARRNDTIATDIECLNRHVSCFSVAWSASESMCIPLLTPNQQNRWTEEEEEEIWTLYAELMSDPLVRKVNQNILFDMTFLLQQNGIFTEGPIDCTMCAHSIIYPDYPKGLDFLCSIYTREPYYKDDGKLWSKPWIDMDRFWEYSCKDSAVAYEIMDQLLPELEEKGHMTSYHKTIDMFPSLMYMMVNGLAIDIQRLQKTKEEAKALLAQREQELREVAEWDFNPGSPKQCQDYFYGTKKIKPYTSIKTGGVTTDDTAMARIVKRFAMPEARLVQEIRGLRKLISSYLEVQYDVDQRIRCSYNPRGTVTGRLSSGETIFGTGMNFCNLDPRFKDFIVADPV